MIDFYTTATANGYKVSIMLEEVGLEYSPKVVDLMKGEHRAADFTAINPAGKVPAIIDRDGPGGEELVLSGTVAILLYLAEKTGKLLPGDATGRAKVYEALALVGTDISPQFTGRFVFNILAPQPQEFATSFYDGECRRMLAVLDGRVADQDYMAGSEYTVADVLAYPVAAVSALGLPEGLEPYPNFARWADNIGAREAVQRGMKVPQAPQ